MVKGLRRNYKIVYSNKRPDKQGGVKGFMKGDEQLSFIKKQENLNLKVRADKM